MIIIRYTLVILLTIAYGSRASADEESIYERLQAELELGVKQGLPGISAAIANADGIIWSGVAGYSDLAHKKPVSPTTLFGIGSITKPFSAIVALQLSEEGRLDLAASAGDILGPELVADIPNTNSATILQLMNHTSGVPTWEFDAEWIPDGRGERFEVGQVWAKDATLEYLRDGDNPATNKPGAQFNYANTNYTLLGLIIEKVTGNDLTEEIRNRILRPLGLKDIYLDGFEPLPRERVAGNYHFASESYLNAAGLHPAFPTIRPGLIETSAYNLSPEWAAGGMVAAASDLARFAAGLAAGKLLNARSRALFFDFRPTQTSDGRMEAGRGIFRMPMREGGPPLINHTGGVLGFSAVMAWLEGTDTSLVVLINVGTMHASPIDESEFTPGHFLNSSQLTELYEVIALNGVP